MDYDYLYDDEDPYYNNYYGGDLEDDDDYYYGGDDSNNNNSNNYATSTPPTPSIEWEEVQVPADIYDREGSTTKAYVLLPPSPPSMHPLPSAVLHFVGGTFFGSAPKTFYNPLLEDIVKNTQCAIVVTPLPVITPLNSRKGNKGGGPLNHVHMAKNLKHQFRTAFEVVLEDEYGSEAMKSVPISGLGHSLGARILVVMATLMKDTAFAAATTEQQQRDNEDEPRKRRPTRRGEIVTEPTYQYKSMILIGFTNFGAAESIPGIKSLLKQRRQLEDKQKQRRGREGGDQQQPERRRRKQRQQSQRGGGGGGRRRKRDAWYNDYFDDNNDDDDWALSETWSEIQQIFQEQTDNIKTRLTPQAEELEFYPSPRQLWAALEGGDGRKPKYNIPQTLLVQFDRDAIDQSSKLATILAATSSSSSEGSEVETTFATNDRHVTDLKFARLRGKHLLPVAMGKSSSSTSSSSLSSQIFREEDEYEYEDPAASGAGGLLKDFSTKTLKVAGDTLKEYFEGSDVPRSTIPKEDALRDLRQTITRYIADVVTK